LRDDLRSSHRFRVHRYNTGVDCTYEVLIEVLTTALPGWKLPAESNLGSALDVLWKGTGDMLDERPSVFKANIGGVEDTPSPNERKPQ
jgi:hypothetical protein